MLLPFVYLGPCLKNRSNVIVDMTHITIKGNIKLTGVTYFVNTDMLVEFCNVSMVF